MGPSGLSDDAQARITQSARDKTAADDAEALAREVAERDQRTVVESTQRVSRLRQTLADHVAAWSTAKTRQAQEKASKLVAEKTTADLRAKQQSDIAAKIEDLEARRDTLLERMTTAHPEVQALDSRLASLHAEQEALSQAAEAQALDTAEESLPSMELSAAPASTPAAADSGELELPEDRDTRRGLATTRSSSALHAASDEAPETFASRYAQLRLKLVEAQRANAAQLVAERRSSHELAEAQAARVIAEAEARSAVTASESSATTVSGWLVSEVAILAGLIAGWLGGPRRKLVVSQAEAASLTDMPVLATLSAAEALSQPHLLREAA